MGEQQVALEHHADRSPLGGTYVRVAVSSSTTPSSTTGRFAIGVETRDRTQERGLPRAVRAEHRDDLARLCLERDSEVERAESQLRCPRRASVEPQIPVAQGHEHPQRNEEKHEAQDDRDLRPRLHREVHRERERLRAAREDSRRT